MDWKKVVSAMFQLGVVIATVFIVIVFVAVALHIKLG